MFHSLRNWKMCAVLFIISSVSNNCAALASGSTNEADNHFQKIVLETACSDPMELAVAPDGRVVFIERAGTIKIWKLDSKATVTAGKLDVNYHPSGSKNAAWEDGLVGITLDPHFARNHWIYLYHSPTNLNENQVSRFVLDGDRLDTASEKIILRVTTQRDVCCHTGGSLTFDSKGNLFISTGDNTNPFESDGYDPIDYRTNRTGWDAAKSAGNTADLRGKILRIHPEPDGSYTIPKGNLFPPGMERTRPEIFVMGCRNPFRISIDHATDELFWGEVGPDANLANPGRGPAGFDEFNRTRRAGNFGWPFLIADNKGYRAYNFETKISGDAFDPQSPKNLSPNNTGLQFLPPSQPAWIWYPYAQSTRFPTVGSGARAACAGPVYHFDPKSNSPHKLPKEFDNAVFLYDWARNWMRTVTLDSTPGSPNIQPFASGIQLKRPIDMELGPDGCLYLIEFGTAWEGNKDSQIVRIEYHE
jgi:cytochrome c